MSQYVVSLLAERPEHELREIQAKARADLARLQVELDQIEQALQKQTQQHARRTSRPSRRRTATSGGTRERVLAAIPPHGADPTSPSRIIAALRDEGSTVSSGAIRNMIRRLMDEGEVDRLREGAYTLASRNGSSGESNAGATENEVTEPLSTATGPQEGS